MKKILLGLMLVSLAAKASIPLTVNGEYEKNRGSAIDRKYSIGSQIYNAQQFGVKGQYSFASQGGAIGDISLLDRDGRAVKLPNKAIITNCLIDVVTQPTSAGSTATIALKMQSAGDLKAAASASGTWTTTSRIACIPAGAVANMIKLTSERTLAITVASEALTAGKINAYVQYVLSE